MARWSVFDENLKRWSSYPVQEVMQIVGSAHEADAKMSLRDRFIMVYCKHAKSDLSQSI